MNATGVSTFSATNASSNSGTATLSTVSTGGTINMSSVGGSGGFTLIGSEKNDIITGSGNADVFEIKSAGAGDGDTLDGAGGTDTLKLSTGTHTFAHQDLLKNIETIETHSSGSKVNLTNQLEAFTITGNAGNDIIIGAGGNDI